MIILKRHFLVKSGRLLSARKTLKKFKAFLKLFLSKNWLVKRSACPGPWWYHLWHWLGIPYSRTGLFRFRLCRSVRRRRRIILVRHLRRTNCFRWLGVLKRWSLFSRWLWPGSGGLSFCFLRFFRRGFCLCRWFESWFSFHFFSRFLCLRLFGSCLSWLFESRLRFGFFGWF